MDTGFEKLNDKQKEAVLSESKQLLILAGAGTGKTSTLTQKIAYLIHEKGISPYNILAITFTNKAANEMRERVKKIVGEYADNMWVLTFHSTCMRILRRFIDRLGYKNTFLIYDTEDKMSIISRLMKERNIGDTLNKKTVASEISNAKLLGQDPEEYEKYISGYEINKKNIASLYNLYQQELKEANALDFDDLIKLTVQLFDENEDIRDYYSNRFEYIFVDEYQDTNMQQFKLVEQLARNHKNLCVVGDDDQSIYKFRGADVQNILGFEKVYPNAEIIKLEQNYRSTKRILDIANVIISNNKNRKEKKLWTENENGEEVRIYDFRNEYEEAGAVISKIQYLTSLDKFTYSDITILYRTNSISRTFEEFLVKENIPYRILGGINFYQRKEIKDIIAYLKIIANPLDSTSLRRIINVPKRSIGEATIQKLAEFSMLHNINLYDAMLMVDNIGNLNDATKKKIKNFTSLIEDFKQQEKIYSVDILIRNIIEDTGYLTSFSTQEEMVEREDNLEELINKAKYFNESTEEGSLIEFLQDISLFTDMDENMNTDNKVTLMTVHSAKGLEFPCVFLVGMEDGLFPFYLAVQEGDLDEERRLCYVALTRAKKLLNVTWSASRRGKFSPKSIFIKEYIDRTGTKATVSNIISISKPKKIGELNKKLIFNKDDFKLQNISKVDFVQGDRVRHRKFGEGTVQEIYKNNEGMLYIKVNFDTNGVKDLAASFAKLNKC